MKSPGKSILHSSWLNYPAGSPKVLWDCNRYILTHYLSCLQLWRSKVPNLVTLDQTYFIQFLVPYAWSHSKMFPSNITIQQDFFLIKLHLKFSSLWDRGWDKLQMEAFMVHYKLNVWIWKNETAHFNANLLLPSPCFCVNFR